MFLKARLKLTLWYVLIILAISGTLSFVIYKRINEDLDRAKRMFVRKELDDRLHLPYIIDTPEVNPQFFEEARDRLKFTLVLINIGLGLVAGGLGYFLAGQTLQPIQDMVDDQQRFIADASHELRTPLTAMRTQLEVTLRDPKRTQKDTTEVLRSNLEEVVALQNLSNNLLELVNNKRSQTLIERVSLQDVFSVLVSRFQSLADQKNIALQIPDTHTSILASRDEIISLLGILLDNAIKYSPEKTIVKVLTDEKNRSAIIQVVDQGVGIDPADIPHVFDRFYRAEKSRSKLESSGYGLGLSIAKKIVDKYNGKITITSEPSRGTTVTLIFKKAQKS